MLGNVGKREIALTQKLLGVCDSAICDKFRGRAAVGGTEQLAEVHLAHFRIAGEGGNAYVVLKALKDNVLGALKLVFGAIWHICSYLTAYSRGVDPVQQRHTLAEVSVVSLSVTAQKP